MNNLFSAIMTKTSGSSLSTDVGGRIFLDEAPQESEYPYIVFFVVSGNPDDVFNKKGKDILLQFSIFSASQGATEITTIYNDLHGLFDDCSMTITSNTMIWMREQNLTTMIDEVTTLTGMQIVKHWAVDYEIIIQSS